MEIEKDSLDDLFIYTLHRMQHIHMKGLEAKSFFAFYTANEFHFVVFIFLNKLQNEFDF